jgi:hypothetical protein
MSLKKCQKFADKLHKGAARQSYPNSKHNSNQIYLGNSERPSKSKFGIQGVGGPPSATSQVMMGGEVLEALQESPREKTHFKAKSIKMSL